MNHYHEPLWIINIHYPYILTTINHRYPPISIHGINHHDPPLLTIINPIINHH
jgi:hypothetical protein